MNTGRHATSFSLRSSLPGRQRWDVAELRRKPRIAEWLEAELQKCAGMIEANANALTGRVLVVFDESILSDVGALLAGLLERLTTAVPVVTAEEEIGTVADAGVTVADASVVGVSPRVETRRLSGENTLLELVRSMEGSSALRWKAAGWTAASSVTSLVPPIALGAIMASALLGGIPFLNHLGLTPFTQIGALAGAYLGGNYLNTFTEFKSKQAWQDYAARIEHALRSGAFRHVMGLDLAYLEGQSNGQIPGVIHDDAARIRSFLTSVPDSALDRLLIFTAGGVFLLSISPVSFALSLIPLPVAVMVYRRSQKEISQRYGTVADHDQGTRKRLSDSIAGMTTIRSYSMEELEVEELEDASLEAQEKLREAYDKTLRKVEYNRFALVAGIGLPIIYAGGLVAAWKITATAFLLQSFLMPKLVGTMGGLDTLYDQYRSADGAAKRFRALLKVSPAVLSGDEPLPLETVEGNVRFEGISFTPPGSAAPLFNGFDLDIPARRSVALVGAGGAGPSTLIRLLLRFYEMDGGRILLDGRDIRALDVWELRQAIGLVSQDTFLFQGTVSENILYGRPDASPDEVREAARAAGALDFIELMPEGFDTVVGERGHRLSSVQRLRLSIARAMLKDAPILIFDAASSSLDNAAEAAIQQSIKAVARDRTVIVIASRLSTVRPVDRIYVLEGGALIDQGTHDGLNAKNDRQYA